MSLASEVAAALRSALATVAAARTEVGAARSIADEMILEIQSATDGSSDERPAEAIVRLQQAQVRLDEALAEFDAGDAAVQEYINVGLGGESGAPSASSPVAERRPPTASPPFKPMRTDQAKADEVRPYIGRDYAVATLWDANGNRILGPHQADNDGPAATAKWNPPWRDYPRLRRHVEAHAAARMHRDGHRETAMYINIPPCKYVDGCRFNVADLIPKGSVMYVHWVQSNDMVRVFRFRGTGRALSE